MGKERLGYRRLYDSVGCSLGGRTEVQVAFPLNRGIAVELYIGPKPRFGIMLSESDRYIIPGVSVAHFRGEYHADATQSPYPRTFFTEVLCAFDVEVPDELLVAFRLDNPQAKEQLFARVKAREQELRNMVEFVSGIIGLRFHRQFVIELVNENFFAVREDAPVQQFVSDAAELLDRPTLNEAGVNQLTSLLAHAGTADSETQDFAGRVFGWLIRAWSERDILSKFVAMFIPLEMILEDNPGEPKPEIQEHRTAIEHLLTQAGRLELLDEFRRLARLDRPSLNSRFRQFARNCELPGWELDVKAFSRFNKMRNALLHKGDPGVLLQVSITEEETRQLEDLAERYICLRFFGDAAVYPSRFRRSS